MTAIKAHPIPAEWTITTAHEVAAIGLRCPHCLSGPGFECRRPSGNKLGDAYSITSHKARMDAALAAYYATA
jgi:hypothetical protein